MKTVWMLMEMITGEPFPHSVFSTHEKLEAYVSSRGGSIDGRVWDVEEVDLDPIPKEKVGFWK